MKKISFILGVYLCFAGQGQAVEVNGINFLDNLVTKPNDHAVLDSLQIHRKPAVGPLKGMDAVQAVLNKAIIFHDGKMMVTYRFTDMLHVIVKVDDTLIKANIMEDAISHKVCFDYRGKAKSYCSNLEYVPGKFTFRNDETHPLDAIVIEGIGK